MERGTIRESDGHLSGADLVRHLDRELAPAERVRQDAHLDGCDRCAAELEVLRDESRRVSGWLDRFDGSRPALRDRSAADGAARDRHARVRHGQDRHAQDRHAQDRHAKDRRVRAIPPWLKAAAAILLVAAPVVAIPGVRAWVAERVPGLARSGPAMPAAGPAGVTDAPARHIRFVPAPGPFTVRFDVGEDRGTLALGRVEAGDAAAGVETLPADAGVAPAAPERPDADAGEAGEAGEAVLRVTGRAEAVVSSGSLRIRNDPAVSGRYSLRLPAATTRVRVLVGSRELMVTGVELDRGIVIPLAPPDAR